MATTAIQQQDPQQLQQARPPSAIQTLADLIASKRDAIAKVAAANCDADRLVKLAQVAITRTPDLMKCPPATIITALMRCAELGVEPNATLPQRRMWLVPRYNTKTRQTECHAQLDYRAEIQLARDTGLVADIVAEEVYQNDVFDYERGDDGAATLTRFRHKPIIFGDRGSLIGFYAAARLEGGGIQFVAMSLDQAKAFRDDYAPRTREGRVVGPWASDKAGEFNAMAKKTCLHRLFNLMPAGKTEAARRLQERLAEETVETGRVDIDVQAAPAVDAPQAARTEGVKAKLAAKLGKAPAAAEPTPGPAQDQPADEPEPTPPGDEWGLDEEPGSRG